MSVFSFCPAISSVLPLKVAAICQCCPRNWWPFLGFCLEISCFTAEIDDPSQALPLKETGHCQFQPWNLQPFSVSTLKISLIVAPVKLVTHQWILTLILVSLSLTLMNSCEGEIYPQTDRPLSVSLPELLSLLPLKLVTLYQFFVPKSTQSCLQVIQNCNQFFSQNWRISSVSLPKCISIYPGNWQAPPSRFYPRFHDLSVCALKSMIYHQFLT